jgi:MSHA biogenesis protein MshO
LNRAARQPQRGFTLIELIMVIVIMGVIGGMVSVFMKGPIDAYLDSARRAALTDVADTVARRMARDIQRSLPNSIRTSGTNCLEFIPTKTGGRYRAEAESPGVGDFLDFSTADTSFNMLGLNSALPTDQRISPGPPADVIVVYNLGIPGSDAYTTTGSSINATTVTSVGGAGTTATETNIGISARQFPLASGSYRFHVVPGGELMVSYVCSASTLRRTASSAFTTTASCPATGSIVASNIDCTGSWFNYAGSDLQRNALVSMVLKVSDSSSGESVSLQHEVHVSNTP